MRPPGSVEGGFCQKTLSQPLEKPTLEMFLDKVAVEVLPLITLKAHNRRQRFDKVRVFLCLSFGLLTLAPHLGLGTDPRSASCPDHTPGLAEVGEHHIDSCSFASKLEELTAWTQVKGLCPHVVMEKETLLAFLLSMTVHRECWSSVHQGVLG